VRQPLCFFLFFQDFFIVYLNKVYRSYYKR
jgi:hypothetical protein